MDIDTDFNAVTSQNAANDVVARVNGNFDVDYAGYLAEIQATDLDVTLDMALEEVTSVVGQIQANIDIPNFQFDADLDVTGLGDQLQIGINVVATTINYLLDLSAL
jgi:hypothetical protein